ASVKRVSQRNAEAVNLQETVRYGVGVAAGWYGCGNTSLPNPSTIKAGINKDGQICLHQGAVDIGQGSNTVIAQIFATALGVSVQDIQLVSADTAITPDAGKTSASRQTFVSGNAARLAGENLREQVLRQTNCGKDSELKVVDGSLHVIDRKNEQAIIAIPLIDLPADCDGYVMVATETYDPPTEALDEHGQGVPYAMFGYAAQMVELSVDITLGTVKLEQFTAAHDVGRVINPVLVEGQIQGGIAQGIGMALMESYLPGKTENLHDYLIPTIGDVPPIKSILIEEPDVHGPYGAKGLGEHVLIPTAPAIINAIRHATGVLVTELPATPDKVSAAIRNSTNV
nr:molybdopterin-dependent oxidoreductase [Gammaproteobacteria bacterium]